MASEKVAVAPDLPSELWFDIFDRLGPTDFCKTVPRVCRRWRELANVIRGPCVTIRSVADVAIARAHPKVHVLCLETTNHDPIMSTADLAPIHGLKDAQTVFALLARLDVNRVRWLHVRGHVHVCPASFNEFVALKISVVRGSITVARAASFVNGISRTGDLMRIMNLTIELPGLHPSTVAAAGVPVERRRRRYRYGRTPQK